MSEVQTPETIAPFVSQEARETFVSDVSGAFKKFEGASRNLVGTLLASARSLERVVTEADWDAHLAKVTRKGIAAKVAAASVKVYLSQAKRATIAASGRPPISEALPLGKHWTDQRTSGRKLEGVNSYDKRISALLKLATRNEAGHLILPEGYSLLGEVTASPTVEPTADATADATGSAGQSADAEGGINVDPAKAKVDARETAATVLMGNAKAAAALLALLADEAGKASLAKLMAEHAANVAKAAKEAKANEKAGETILANANA